MTRNNGKAFRATIAPGVKPSNFDMYIDIKDFHCSFGHVHEGLLRETAKQRNVNLTGTLQECQGCSIAKGRAKPISRQRKHEQLNPAAVFFLIFLGKECAVDRGGEVYAHDSR